MITIHYIIRFPSSIPSSRSPGIRCTTHPRGTSIGGRPHPGSAPIRCSIHPRGSSVRRSAHSRSSSVRSWHFSELVLLSLANTFFSRVYAWSGDFNRSFCVRCGFRQLVEFISRIYVAFIQAILLLSIISIGQTLFIIDLVAHKLDYLTRRNADCVAKWLWIIYPRCPSDNCNWIHCKINFVLFSLTFFSQG